jgi:hypothetical protein
VGHSSKVKRIAINKKFGMPNKNDLIIPIFAAG